MARRLREYVEIPDRISLDALIERLLALRDTLPADSDATLRMQGDETFGRRLSICYLRPQTVEEAARDARYSGTAESKQPASCLPDDASGRHTADDDATEDAAFGIAA